MISAVRFALFLFLSAASPAAALEVTYAAGTSTAATTTYTASDQPLTIRCAGSSQSKVILPAGLDITYSDQKLGPHIEGCTFVTEGANAGTALKITGPTLGTATLQGPRIYDVSIRGDDLTVDYWTRGIQLVSVWNPILRDVNIKGLDQAAPTFSMTSGLEFDASQVVDIEKLDVYHAQDAVKQLGSTYGEGFSLRDFNLVGVNRGVVLLAGGGYVIADGHVNAYQTGIDLTGKSQLVMDNLLLYKTHNSAANYIGINVSTAQQLKVTNVTVDGGWQTAQQCSGTTYGMVLGVTSKSHFAGNLCTNFKTASACIVVGYQSANNTFIANRTDGAGTVVQVNGDAGAGNKLDQNW